MRVVPALLLLVSACTTEGGLTDKKWKQVDNTALGLVGHHPNDPAALDAAIEECDTFDHYVWASIGRLIAAGKIKTTEKGLVVVDRAEWPKEDTE